MDIENYFFLNKKLLILILFIRMTLLYVIYYFNKWWFFLKFWYFLLGPNVLDYSRDSKLFKTVTTILSESTMIHDIF